jgi:hypothetical protein
LLIAFDASIVNVIEQFLEGIEYLLRIAVAFLLLVDEAMVITADCLEVIVIESHIPIYLPILERAPDVMDLDRILQCPAINLAFLEAFLTQRLCPDVVLAGFPPLGSVVELLPQDSLIGILIPLAVLSFPWF